MTAVFSRDLPKPYIEAALALFRDRGLSSIVEIGTMRGPLDHPLSDIDITCCGDGHSSLYWASETDDFVTVDVDFAAAINAGKAVKLVLGKFAKVKCVDGVQFLSQYDESIDLLFLDAWDAFLPMSAEHHLEAFEAAERLLQPRSLVLIDDTDADFDLEGQMLAPSDEFAGKGKLLVPYMLERGWTILFNGRQTLLAKNADAREKQLVDRELMKRQRKVREEILAKHPDYFGQE